MDPIVSVSVGDEAAAGTTLAPKPCQPGAVRRALLLRNPKASHGQDDVRAALARLEQAGMQIIEPRAQHKTKVSELIRTHRDQADMIIVGGGDGTLNAAVDALVEARLPLGILPLGTANDLARTLGIPADAQAACEVICAGHRRDIDLGWVNGKHFFNVASLGLSTEITTRLTRKAKSRWGVFAYLFTAAQVLFHARPFAVELSDGEKSWVVRSVQIAVGNGRHYGGGMTVDENARIDDRLLHFYSLEIERWWQMLPLIPKLRRGTLAGTAHVRTLCGREFHVRPLRRPRPINTDGEITTRTPGQFRIIPAAISVFVPPSGAAPGLEP